jgi:hypothetical protein
MSSFAGSYCKVEEIQQNEDVEWIKRHEKGKITYINWAPVRNAETTVLFSQAHNWKSPGSDQIPNY